MKANEVPKYTRMLLIKQKYICPICGDSLTNIRRALDHDHDKGNIRAVLCNTCNRNEGKVKSAVKFMAKRDFLGRVDYIKWLENLILYLKKHKERPLKIIHHSYDLKTGKQKPTKRKKNELKTKKS